MMNLNEQFEKALIIATEAHIGQTRLNGESYSFHFLRVSFKCKTMIAKIAAILHDVIEDSDFDEKYLLSHGIDKQIVDIVSILTHGQESYKDYIERVSTHPICVEVKIADLEDNMDLFQLPELTDHFASRLKKYHQSYNYLKE